MVAETEGLLSAEPVFQAQIQGEEVEVEEERSWHVVPVCLLSALFLDTGLKEEHTMNIRNHVVSHNPTARQQRNPTLDSRVGLRLNMSSTAIPRRNRHIPSAVSVHHKYRGPGHLPSNTQSNPLVAFRG